MAEEEKNNERESLSSIELTQTTKGTNVKVKIYNKDPLEAKEMVEKLFDDLVAKYKKEES